MRLFRKLFAEKILRYYEGTEGGIRLIKSLPLVKKHLKEDAFGEKSKGRMAVGIISQLIMLLWEFIRKLLYVWLFMFIPYMIMAHFFPLIKLHQDTTIIYLFVMLSTICGSFSNTTIFAMGDRGLSYDKGNARKPVHEFPWKVHIQNSDRICVLFYNSYDFPGAGA